MEALRMLSKAEGRGGDYDAEVERLLSCPICLEVYSKPVVILPCQHNLCRKCANDVFQNRGTPMGSGGRFRCPTCRYEVMLDRHGVYGLQRNLLVENIIDMYQSESKKPFRKLEVLMCEEHDEEKVNIFCITCQKPTCSLCKVFGQHQECTVSPMEKVYKDHKTEISGAIAMLVAGNDRVQNVIAKAEELTTQTEENSKKIHGDICVSFDQLYAVLEQRKQAMLSRVKALTQEKTEVLQSMLKKYGNQLESSSKLVEESLSILEEPSVPQFLCVSRELINRVTSTAKASDVPKPPADISNMDAFEIDFSDHATYLRQITFPNADPEDEVGSEDGYETTSDQTSTESETTRRTSNASSSDVFHAKLLLPKSDAAEEVVAAAKVTRKEDADEFEDTESQGSRRNGRKNSSTSVDDSKDLDQLDDDVKAIAERYLSSRASRLRSQASSAYLDSSASSDMRRRSYSEERDKLSTTGDPYSKSAYGASGTEPRDASPMGVTWRSTATPRTRFQVDSVTTTQSPDRLSSRGLRSSSPSSVSRTRDSVPPINEATSADSDTSHSPRPRRSTRRLQRNYATHRRRTWSHLLDKR